MNWEEERLLYRIAKLYYEEGYTQAEISKELGIYRTTIGRKLKKAREKGIVKIQIQTSSNTLFELEEQIANEFNMKEVIIVPSYKNQSEEDTLKSVAKASSSLLDRVILDQDIVGVAWGTTLGYIVHQLDDLKPKKIQSVPLVGGPGGMNTDYHVNTIALKMAEAFQGESHFIDAAAIYKTKDTTQEILNSSFMQEVLALWEKLTVAIVGIGAPISSSNMVWSGFLGESEKKKLQNYHAIGDIVSRFYTLEGEIIPSSIAERTVAIELDTLKKLRYSIGIAYSKEKANSIIGAMKGQFINTLITNEETALEIKKNI